MSCYSMSTKTLLQQNIFRHQSSKQAYVCILLTILLFELIAVPIVEAQFEYGYYFGKRARNKRKKRIKKRQKSRKKSLKKFVGKMST